MEDAAAAQSGGSGGGGDNNSVSNNDHMSEEAQDNRRKQIKDIMKDQGMSQADKSRAIQSLMDGRRRSITSVQSTSTHSHTHSLTSGSHHYASTMARAAAQAHDYYSSDEEGDAIMSDGSVEAGGGGVGVVRRRPQQPDDISYGYEYDRHDERSVASSVTTTSYQSNADIPPPLPPGTYRQVHGRSYSLQDWTDGDRAAAAASTNFIENPAQISRLMEQSRPQCEHYERNCTLVSPCCGLAFGCRICHDECPALPKPLALRQHGMDDSDMLVNMQTHQHKMERRRSMPLDLEEEDENHHCVDRFAVREVICRSCYTRQSSKANKCVSCGIQFGDYHCNVCNLWMSGQENPYHCIDCGFCRVGGRHNFKHCDDCGMCIDALLFDDHNCKAGKYMSNCPVCQEDLFSSRYASHEMPCGHAIHWHCFKELTSYDTRCPVCKKTAETPEHMASTWSAIAMGIALQPVPPDMARVVNILCNDCEKPDTNRRWHFLGVRCMNCLSFNTNCEQIVMQGRDAATFLDELEASRAVSDENDVPQDIAISTTPTSPPTSPDRRSNPNNRSVMDEDVPSAQETSSGSTPTDLLHDNMSGQQQQQQQQQRHFY